MLRHMCPLSGELADCRAHLLELTDTAAPTTTYLLVRDARQSKVGHLDKLLVQPPLEASRTQEERPI